LRDDCKHKKGLFPSEQSGHTINRKMGPPSSCNDTLWNSFMGAKGKLGCKP